MKIRFKIIIVLFSLSLQSVYPVEPNVRAWGTNTYHQLDVPADLTNAIAVRVGDTHVLALRSDGTVVAWGDNNFGQCDVPAGLTNVVSISAGHGNSVALKADGNAVFWGGLFPGGLTGPPPASFLTNLAAIESDANILVLTNGVPAFYGMFPAFLPSDLTNGVAISVRWDLCAILRSDGSVGLWGGSDHHPGVWFDWNVPVFATNAVAASVGDGYVLTLRSNGTVEAFGSPWYGTFEVPAGLTNVIGISAGYGFSFAVRADGTVAAWGTRALGTQSLDPTPGSFLPPDLPFVSQISAGYNVSAALIRPGQVVSPPTILQQPSPANLNAVIGADAIFRVAAGGFPPLSYQWYFGTTAIEGATNATLYLAGLKAEQSGAYKVAVSNPGGTIWSEPANLNVLPALEVHMVPAITLFGTVGLNYRIDYLSPHGAPDSWTSVATITLTNSPQFYFDASAIGQQGRLYRAVQLP